MIGGRGFHSRACRRLRVKNYKIRATTRAAATAVVLMTLVGFATTAPAQSTVPEVISSSQTDSGSYGQPYLTMTLPDEVTAGQLLLATVVIQGANSSAYPWARIDIPAGGWTEIAPSPQVCDGDLAMSVSWRIAQPNDSPETQFTWGFLSESSDKFLTPLVASGAIISVANVNTTSPIDAITSLCTAQSTQATAPSITTVHNDSLNILVYGITGDKFLSKPSGYSQIFQHPVFGIGPDLTNDSLVIPAAGTNTGALISTANGAGDSFGYQVDLAPATSSQNGATKATTAQLSSPR
jgi:hypothetical protein